MSDLIIALAEEIGHPDFFMGRKAEMKSYLDWAEGTKTLVSKSQALLSRRKKGKTALVQRLFNILYTNNDPKIIPFFFRIPEFKMSVTEFSLAFYCAFLGQYLGFRRRDPHLINNVPTFGELRELVKDEPELLRDVRAMEELKDTRYPAWRHAQSAPHRFANNRDCRVIQIIDEFQYMNRFLYSLPDLKEQVDLCHSYMGLAESKYAPLLVTGSYIGWLTTILNYMTARFEPDRLGSLTDEEALAAVYNYAGIMNRPVTEDTAAYITDVAYNDPFYISQIVRTKKRGVDLTTRSGVRDALQFETTYPEGYTANVWMEYIAEGVQRVNDVNGKNIVLYLAKYGDEERTREQIARDLQLNVSDQELADRLHILEQADLIAKGSSNFHFKGLGDPIFAAVFRKHYGVEIERIGPERIKSEFEEEMKKARRQTNWFKGLAGEYRVMYHLLFAANQGRQPDEVFFNPTDGFTLQGLGKLGKKTFHWNQNTSTTVDFHARNTGNGSDLIAEVKTWKKAVSADVVAPFIALKQDLTPQLEHSTAFLFYSENGFTPEAEQKLLEHGVMYTTHEKLTGTVSDETERVQEG